MVDRSTAAIHLIQLKLVVEHLFFGVSLVVQLRLELFGRVHLVPQDPITLENFVKE